MRGRAALGILVLTPVLLLAACQSGLSAEGEPLTIEQSEDLAQTRFQLAAGGDGVLDVAIGAPDDVAHVIAHLTVDYDDGLAWGEVERGPDGIAVAERVAFTPDVYLVEGAAGWQAGASPSALLGIVFVLGADRPENAQLLRQSDARYLGEAEDGGETLRVFRTPGVDGEQALTRLWIDEDGRLHRLDAGDDETLVLRPADEEPAARIAEIDRLLGLGDE